MVYKEYIEREAVNEIIKQLSREPLYQHEGEDYYDGVCDVDGELAMLPAADVVEKTQYLHVLKLAKKMHTWIFLNTGDEQAAYDEMGLTDEDNALLGYSGKLELAANAKMDIKCE
jgi:hypothetical protein